MLIWPLLSVGPVLGLDIFNSLTPHNNLMGYVLLLAVLYR